MKVAQDERIAYGEGQHEGNADLVGFDQKTRQKGHDDNERVQAELGGENDVGQQTGLPDAASAAFYRDARTRSKERFP